MAAESNAALKPAIGERTDGTTGAPARRRQDVAGDFGAQDERLIVVEAIQYLPLSVVADPARRIVMTRFRALDSLLSGESGGGGVVAAPLIGHGFDICDVAETLSRNGFRGRILCMCPPGTDARAVAAEIAGRCRGIPVRLIETARPLPRKGAGVSRPPLRAVPR